MIIRISFRDIFEKTAENPNKYPWNVSDHSKDKDTGNPEEISSRPQQKMVSIKMDKNRVQLKPKDIHYLNWEMLNQLGQDNMPNGDTNSDKEIRN